MAVRAIGPDERAGFPLIEPDRELPEGAPSVVVTGCFDWLHSGHIRFFMDAAAHGALYVVIGSDRNVRLLKGAGHPLQREEERRYMVGSMKPVYRCLVSSGSGWMDAEPEIDLLKPTSYVVNEDGDKPEKRAVLRGPRAAVRRARAGPARGAAGPFQHGSARVLGPLNGRRSRLWFRYHKEPWPLSSMSPNAPASRP